MDTINCVAITGYYGTGSSAVLDLLKEYEGNNVAAPVKTEYEHIALYYPGGLFDLYSVLSSPFHSAYNSDMAINNFIIAAKRQNDYDYGWFGSYKKYYGETFMNMTMDFVNRISRKTGRQSTAHTFKTSFNPIKALLQIAAKIIIKRPITKLGRVYVNDKTPGFYSMPSLNDLQDACKQYTDSYIRMVSKENNLNIFDHLIWPQQTFALNYLFSDSLKVIVVQRDPRDVFLLNKYYWFKPPVTISKPYYPTDTNTFCKEWKETIRYNKDNDRVLNIFFEDLIYNYDETVALIEKFLNINSSRHIFKNKSFKPEMSIENTQIFLVNDKWREEVKSIEEDLSEYLYHFPYERTPDKSQWFDGEAQIARINKNKK